MPRIVRAPPAAHHDTRTLDIPERQVLLNFDEDHYEWHARILLLALGAARWICCTPTFDIEIEDFADETVHPLSRNSSFPMGGFRPIFAFRPSEVTEAALATMRAAAAALAEVMGVVVAPAAAIGGLIWYFADAAEEFFGEPVPISVVSDAEKAIIRNSVGLATIPGVNGTTRWTTMERMSPNDKEEWLAEKREGAGRDKRLAKHQSDPSGGRALFRTAISGMNKSLAPNGEIFSGPSSVAEVCTAIADSGLEPPGFQAQWVTSSGVPPTSSAARESAFLLYLLWLLATVDRFDLFACAGAEHICRRYLQLQRAVRRNPRAPDYEGLGAYLEHAMESSGNVRSQNFDKYVAGIMEAEARILKQQRLNREENQHETDRTGASSSTQWTPKDHPTPKAKAKAKAKDGT